MTTHRPHLLLPDATAASATAAEIVSSLLLFADSFGVTRDTAFNQRCCGLAFTNAVMLGVIQPDGAAWLRAILRPHAPDDVISQGMASCVAGAVGDDDHWLASIRQSLATCIARLPNSDLRIGLTPQIITALSVEPPGRGHVVPRYLGSAQGVRSQRRGPSEGVGLCGMWPEAG